ncbi:mitochondrial substrate carrier family protein B-like [Iris pallida]|uniref:Mitochondrial substrate carrier family protein B-like n=1 Tax=Iris pallida TaxID=29817 RepID=A0AAX6EI03_IRIPA|nr:mitochondrial substrate carrier family protein B-like [Iris pallida]
MQTEARVTVAGGFSADSGPRKYTSSAIHRRPQRQQQQQMGTISNLLAGGVAGAVSKTCTAPLARITILFQVQGMHSDVATLRKASMWREASRIVYEEGVKAFWKGNLVTIAHRLPYSSISFFSYERYKNLLQLVPGLDKHKDYVSADICLRLLGGGLSGITAASITYPLDLVRTRLAAQFACRFTICRLVAGLGLDAPRHGALSVSRRATALGSTCNMKMSCRESLGCSIEDIMYGTRSFVS